MTRKVGLRIWVEGAIVATMAIALSFLPIEFANSGLGLSLGMVPLVLYSFRRGLLPRVAAGFVWGMLNTILGTAMKNFLSIPQIIFEYPFAFAFGRMGDIFARGIQLCFQANRLKSAIHTITLGNIMTVFVRQFWHFQAGILAWDIYVPEGIGPYLYSFVLNGTSTVINCLCISLILSLLAKVAPQLFVPKKQVES